MFCRRFCHLLYRTFQSNAEKVKMEIVLKWKRQDLEWINWTKFKMQKNRFFWRTAICNAIRWKPQKCAECDFLGWNVMKWSYKKIRDMEKYDLNWYCDWVRHEEKKKTHFPFELLCHLCHIAMKLLWSETELVEVHLSTSIEFIYNVTQTVRSEFANKMQIAESKKKKKKKRKSAVPNQK